MFPKQTVGMLASLSEAARSENEHYPSNAKILSALCQLSYFKNPCLSASIHG